MVKLRDAAVVNAKLLSKSYIKDFLNNIEKDDELLYFFRQDYISVYYKGYNMLSINPRSIAVSDYIKNPLKVVTGSIAERFSTHLKQIPIYKAELDNSALINGKKSNERNIQHEIAKRFSKNICDGFIVIDFEFMVVLPNKKRAKPDLVVVEMVDGKAKNFYIVEYKMNPGACSGTSGLKSHINDFQKIIDSDMITTIKNSIVDLCELKQIELSEEIDVKFALLFTDMESNQFKGYFDDKDYNLYVWIKDNDFNDFGTPKLLVKGSME